MTTTNEPSEAIEGIVMLSSICGEHFDEGCDGCQSAKESNDQRIQAAAGDAVAEALKQAEKIAKAHATCGCKGKHGTCLSDDTPLAIAKEIRELREALSPNAPPTP